MSSKFSVKLPQGAEEEEEEEEYEEDEADEKYPKVNPDPSGKADALYLLVHNASHFGEPENKTPLAPWVPPPALPARIGGSLGYPRDEDGSLKDCRPWKPQDSLLHVTESLQAQAERWETVERQHRDAEEHGLLQEAHERAVTALENGKAAMETEDFGYAADMFLSGLEQGGSLFPSMQDQGPKYRWDLEQWMLVAKLRGSLKKKDLSTALTTLLTVRESSHLGATLDNSSHAGLTEALEKAQEEFNQQTKGLFTTREEDIQKWSDLTNRNVTNVDKVLRCQIECVEDIMKGQAENALEGILSAMETSKDFKHKREREIPVLPAVHNSTMALSAAALFCWNAERACKREWHIKLTLTGEVTVATWSAGAALCAYSCAHRKLCSVEPVTHAASEHDIPEAVVRLKQWLVDKAITARDELWRRSTVRRTFLQGQSAHDRGALEVALRHWNTIKQVAGEDQCRLMMIDRCIAQTEAEKQRQVDVQKLQEQALAALISEDQPTSAATELYQQALTLETDALRERLEEGSRESPERSALKLMVQACVWWEKGDDALANWKGEESRSAYSSAHMDARAASNVVKTPGYYGDKVQLNEEAQSVLDTSLRHANEEVDRRKKLAAYLDRAMQDLNFGNAVAALSELDHAETMAANPEAKQQVAVQQELARTEKKCQEDVKELHSRALEKLEGLDPAAAAELYAQALELNEAGAQHGDGPEHVALENMQKMCTAWHNADLQLGTFEGKSSNSAYVDAKNEAFRVTQLEVTKGYCGVKIELSDDATHLLQKGLEKATDEMRRKGEFTTHLDDGKEKLRSRRAVDALADLSFAEKKAASPAEKEQVDEQHQLANTEKMRQESVKSLQDQALSTLVADDQATSVAIDFYQQALVVEAEPSTPEHIGLVNMVEACVLWEKGDIALATWKGEESREAYTNAQSKAMAAVSAKTTMGYFGDKVQFNTPVEDALDECLRKAQEEVDRKDCFEENMDNAEVSLDAIRAVEALVYLSAAEALAASPEEKQEVGEQQVLANTEKTRQEDVKDLHSRALGALVAADAEGAAQLDTTPAIELYQQALELEPDGERPENESLTHLLELCRHWRDGTAKLGTWDGKAALELYQSAENCSDAASITDLTIGYRGAKIELSEEARKTLENCVLNAKTEIERNQDYLGLMESGKQSLTVKKAADAKRAFETAGRKQSNDREREQAEEWVHNAVVELDRQQEVKRFYTEGVEALQQNSPARAAELFRSALQVEPSEDISEHSALIMMLQASEKWQTGNDALAGWDGGLAQSEFEACIRLTIAAREDFAPTEGYDGPRVELGAASDALAEQTEAAAAEKARNDNYERLMVAEGAADLMNHSPDSALALFLTALEISETDAERAGAREQIEAATIQLRRQKEVKRLQDKALAALVSNEGTGHATEFYRQALARETPLGTAEEGALSHLVEAFVWWEKGDLALANWQGEESRSAYNTASMEAQAAAGITETQGYYGDKVQLNEASLIALAECLTAAEEEVDRRASFVEYVGLSDSNLQSGSALEAVAYLEMAADLAASPAEKEQAAEQQQRADGEKQRQEQVKSLHYQALAALNGDESTNAAIEFYRQALALETEESPERAALLHMVAACISWEKADVALATWKGEESKQSYTSVMEEAAAAVAITKNPGYLGDKIQLDEAADGTLDGCLTKAQEEVDRKIAFEEFMDAAKFSLDASRAVDAIELLESAETRAASPGEKQRVAGQQQDANTEKQRQANVKDLHKRATIMLVAKDSEGAAARINAQPAIDLYQHALELEPQEAGRPESEALNHMLWLCRHWRDGNAKLGAWEGKAARDFFYESEGNSNSASATDTTPGYFGTRIELSDAAVRTLKECIRLCDVEIERRYDFDLCMENGNANLETSRALDACVDFDAAVEHARSEAEKHDATERRELAGVEHDRQADVKQCHVVAVAILAEDEASRDHRFGLVRFYSTADDAPMSAIEFPADLQGRCEPQVADMYGSRARLAVTLYREALEYESEDYTTSGGGSGECQALTQLQATCVSWHEGDKALRRFPQEDVQHGEEALRHFAAAEHASERATNCDSTPGYVGEKMVLGVALYTLRDCKMAARKETERDRECNDLIEAGSLHLGRLDALKAMESFEQVGFWSIDQRNRAQEGYQRAQAEMHRQQSVKALHELAIAALVHNSPEVAMGLYVQALELEQGDGPEQEALAAMANACQAWLDGNVALASWRGEDAEDNFRKSQLECERAARDNIPTAGYFGDDIQITTDAERTLLTRIEAAMTRIASKNDLLREVAEGTEYALRSDAKLAIDGGIDPDEVPFEVHTMAAFENFISAYRRTECADDRSKCVVAMESSMTDLRARLLGERQQHQEAAESALRSTSGQGATALHDSSGDADSCESLQLDGMRAVLAEMAAWDLGVVIPAEQVESELQAAIDAANEMSRCNDLIKQAVKAKRWGDAEEATVMTRNEQRKILVANGSRLHETLDRLEKGGQEQKHAQFSRGLRSELLSLRKQRRKLQYSSHAISEYSTARSSQPDMRWQKRFNDTMAVEEICVYGSGLFSKGTPVQVAKRRDFRLNGNTLEWRVNARVQQYVAPGRWMRVDDGGSVAFRLEPDMSKKLEETFAIAQSSQLLYVEKTVKHDGREWAQVQTDGLALYVPMDFLEPCSKRPKLWEREAAYSQHRRLQQRLLSGWLKEDFRKWADRLGLEWQWAEVQNVIVENFRPDELFTPLAATSTQDDLNAFFSRLQKLLTDGGAKESLPARQVAAGARSEWNQKPGTAKSYESLSLRPWYELKDGQRWRKCDLLNTRYNKMTKTEDVLIRGFFDHRDKAPREEWLPKNTQNLHWRESHVQCVSAKTHNADNEEAGKDTRTIQFAFDVLGLGDAKPGETATRGKYMVRIVASSEAQRQRWKGILETRGRSLPPVDAPGQAIRDSSPSDRAWETLPPAGGGQLLKFELQDVKFDPEPVRQHDWAADSELEPEPEQYDGKIATEPEPEPSYDQGDGAYEEARTTWPMTMGPARLDAVKQLAQLAVQTFRQWQDGIDHRSAFMQTDADIDGLAAAVATAGGEWAAGEDVPAKLLELCAQLEDCVTVIVGSVRSERALREIRPKDTLRAIVWGRGKQFPQLSDEALESTIDRYMSARIGRRSLRESGTSQQLQDLAGTDAPLANGMPVRDEAAARAASQLRGLMEANATPPQGQPLVVQGLFMLCLTIRSQLMDETQALLQLRVCARDEQVDDTINRCTPFADAVMPT